MKQLPGVTRQQEARILAAPACLLMLDYDGTLAPFRLDWREAAPTLRLIDLLGRLLAGRKTRIVIVSGRPVASLSRLLEPLPIPLVGEHGWERRLPGERTISHPLDHRVAAALHQAAARASAREWAARLERKRTSIMLHTRGLSPDQAGRIETECARLWEVEVEESGLLLGRVGGGLELRAPGRDKGTAIRDLLKSCPPGTLGVYLGDDQTDEDAFAALVPGGIGILVSSSERPTLAAGRLGTPDDVEAFLEGWLVLVERHGGSMDPTARSSGLTER